jgi:hypothetical protein
VFVESGAETLVHFRKENVPYYISVDEEAYAHMINDGYEVVEEIMQHTRLPVQPEFDLTEGQQ